MSVGVTKKSSFKTHPYAGRKVKLAKQRTVLSDYVCDTNQISGKYCHYAKNKRDLQRTKKIKSEVR